MSPPLLVISTLFATFSVIGEKNVCCAWSKGGGAVWHFLWHTVAENKKMWCVFLPVFLIVVEFWVFVLILHFFHVFWWPASFGEAQCGVRPHRVVLFVPMAECSDEQRFVSVCVPPQGRRAFGDWDFQLDFTASVHGEKIQREKIAIKKIFGAPEKIEGKGTYYSNKQLA